MNNKIETKNNNKKELVINGEKVKFYYNREERLAMVKGRIENNNCFFCKKNISFFILAGNLLFIIIFWNIYNTLIGKSKAIIYNNLTYIFSIKENKNENFIDIKIQIKNGTKKLINIEDNELYFEIYDQFNSLIYNKSIILYEKFLKPDEYIIKDFTFTKTCAGKYYALLYIDNNKNKKLKINFNM